MRFFIPTLAAAIAILSVVSTQPDPDRDDEVHTTLNRGQGPEEVCGIWSSFDPNKPIPSILVHRTEPEKVFAMTLTLMLVLLKVVLVVLLKLAVLLKLLLTDTAKGPPSPAGTYRSGNGP